MRTIAIPPHLVMLANEIGMINSYSSAYEVYSATICFTIWRFISVVAQGYGSALADPVQSSNRRGCVFSCSR